MILVHTNYYAYTCIEKFETVYTKLEEFLICRLVDNVDRRHISDL